MSDFFDYLMDEWVKPITRETEPPVLWPEEMRQEWKKDRNFLIGERWKARNETG